MSVAFIFSKKKLINYTIFKLLSAVRRVLVQFDLHYVQVIPFLTVHQRMSELTGEEVRHNNMEESVLYYIRKYHNDFTLRQIQLKHHYSKRSLTSLKL